MFVENNFKNGTLYSKLILAINTVIDNDIFHFSFLCGRGLNTDLQSYQSNSVTMLVPDRNRDDLQWVFCSPEENKFWITVLTLQLTVAQRYKKVQLSFKR